MALYERWKPLPCTACGWLPSGSRRQRCLPRSAPPCPAISAPTTFRPFSAWRQCISRSRPADERLRPRPASRRIWGEREAGPSGAKKTFLNLGKVFLRALAKDLGLREAKITSDSGGIAVSGGCDLIGMWENGGIYISLSQFCGGKDNIEAYHAAQSFRLLRS